MMSVAFSAAGSVSPPRQVTGWGPYSFGMSVEEVRQAGRAVAWDEDAINACWRKRRVRYGCSLNLPTGSTWRLGRQRLAFTPTLAFAHNRLSEIWLSHEQRRTMRPSECLKTYAAILDGLWRDYGAFSAPDRPARWIREGWRIDRVRTRGGVSFSLGHPIAYRDFSIEDARSHRPASVPVGSTDEIDAWGGAHVRINGQFVFWPRDPAVCMVTVAYISKEAAYRYAHPDP